MVTRPPDRTGSRGTRHRHRLLRRRYPTSHSLEVLQNVLAHPVLLSNIDKLAQIFRKQKIKCPVERDAEFFL